MFNTSTDWVNAFIMICIVFVIGQVEGFLIRIQPIYDQVALARLSPDLFGFRFQGMLKF